MRHDVLVELRKEVVRFNTASGMRSHATGVVISCCFQLSTRFNTASGMRSHATPEA